MEANKANLPTNFLIIMRVALFFRTGWQIVFFTSKGIYIADTIKSAVERLKIKKSGTERNLTFPVMASKTRLFPSVPTLGASNADHR